MHSASRILILLIPVCFSFICPLESHAGAFDRVGGNLQLAPSQSLTPKASFLALISHQTQLRPHEKAVAMEWAQTTLHDATGSNDSFKGRKLAEFYRLLETYLGAPYAPRGAENGYDCSGFTMAAMKEFHVTLPSSSRAQAEEGAPVTRDSLRPGDLVFFDRWDKQINRISHVGIYLGGGVMIHGASRFGVTLHSIEHEHYKKRYMTARRL